MSLFVVFIATRLFAVLAKEEGFFFLLPLSSSHVSHVDLQRTEPGCHRPRVIPSLNVIRGGRHFDTPVRRVGDAGKQNGASSEEKREKCSRGVGKKMQERETTSRRRISFFVSGASSRKRGCLRFKGDLPRTNRTTKKKQQTAGASQAVRRLSTHTRPSEQPSPRFYEPNPSHFSLHYFSFGSNTLLLFASLDLKAKQSTRRFSPQNKARSRPMLR